MTVHANEGTYKVDLLRFANGLIETDDKAGNSDSTSGNDTVTVNLWFCMLTTAKGL